MGTINRVGRRIELEKVVTNLKNIKTVIDICFGHLKLLRDNASHMRLAGITTDQIQIKKDTKE